MISAINIFLTEWILLTFIVTIVTLISGRKTYIIIIDAIY